MVAVHAVGQTTDGLAVVKDRRARVTLAYGHVVGHLAFHQLHARVSERGDVGAGIFAYFVAGAVQADLEAGAARQALDVRESHRLGRIVRHDGAAAGNASGRGDGAGAAATGERQCHQREQCDNQQCGIRLHNNPPGERTVSGAYKRH